MNWAKLIRDLQQAGMTQAEIAASVGCSRPHISDIANGRRGRRMAYEVGAGLVGLHAERAAPNSAAPQQIAEEPSRMKALEKAIEILGSQTKLAAALGVRIQVVNNWIRRGNVPPAYAPSIEAATGGQVRAEELCPSVAWHVIRGSRAA